MKKIFLICAIAASVGLSSCNETWDNNPVLKTHEGVVTADFLNNPVMQDQYIMLTNENAQGTFHLTCSQPDFGYAAVASYQVQCSLTSDFANYEEISQVFYDCSEINPTNADVAAALEYLCDVKTENDLPLEYHKLYMRVKAYIAQSPDNTQFISNVVSFAGVSANYLAIWVADVPVDIYLRGGFDTDWAALPEYQFVTGSDKNTWVLDNVSVSSSVEFKIADSSWGPLNLGAGDNAVITPGEAYTLNGGENPGNLKLSEDFTGLIQLSLDNGVYTVIFDPAR